MNVDSPSDSNKVSSSGVTSKYFDCNGGMDESLSDFQEKKNFTSAKCTKKVQKPSTSKPKPKKLKRIRGQKDIRTVLNKKNELVSYSNDFDKICKKSGIDVDPEQLQLAIALSKSLQQTGSPVEEDLNLLTTQERTNKIRTTLQEYGFVVPEVKITATKSRKLKKYRKNYKLLQTTEAEKQQIVSDKYSQVLFQNIDNTRNTNNSDKSIEYSAQLYHIGTNISYEEIRNNAILYVKDLLEISPSFVGCLLKDWTKIPGRPSSPSLELPNIKFERISCTQEELDTVLSGHLNSVQEIVKNKYSLLPLEETFDSIIKVEKCVEKDTKMDDCIEILEDDDINTLELSRKEISTENKQIEVIDVENPNLLTVKPSIRSCSPDIFDDEVSEIIESSNQNTDIPSQELPNKDATKTCYDTMDLTECAININSQLTILKPITLSQGNNSTKRKSNDFMDMTECVGASQPIRENIIEEENIDLTQSPDDNIGITNRRGYSLPIKEKEKTVKENIDLTQSPNDNSDITRDSPQPKNIELPKRHDDNEDITNRRGSPQIIRKDIIEEDIDLTDSPDDNRDNKNSRESIKHKDVQSLDLTQSSDTNEELPVVQISGRESMDDTIILNEDAYSEHHEIVHSLERKSTELSNGTQTQHRSFPPIEENKHHNTEPISIDSEDETDNQRNIQNKELESRAISPIECINSNNRFEFDQIETVISQNKSIETFDVTQNQASPKHSEENNSKSKTESFFEEFVYRHSDNSSSKENTDIINVEISQHILTNDNNYDGIESEKIDLTQEATASEKVNSPKISYSSSLGKVGDVSIDYDEVFDDMVRSHASSATQSKSISAKSHTTDFSNENLDKPSNSELVSNSSQNSEPFEISDQELDYSIHKSRLDFNPNFDFGGISVMDNLPDLPSFRPSTNNENNSLNRSMSDSYLPTVDIKSIGHENKTKSCNSESLTPCKISKEAVIAKTPKNGEYIIKTDEVTPALDYERMTTPERNAELDKYGLKPFKRKRAIQLLTHLYNQTHPIVESLENLPSPSKRFKPSTIIQTSPTKRKSPKKKYELHKSQKNVPESQQILDPEGDEREVMNKENDIYDVTNEVPDIRNIECLEEDWVFQKREKAKLHTCRVPLHVALHNYVYARSALRECILRYEPVDIDCIHKGLVANGFRYDPKDLLKFMDKKCITVKTTDNNNKNKKHY